MRRICKVLFWVCWLVMLLPIQLMILLAFAANIPSKDALGRALAAACWYPFVTTRYDSIMRLHNHFGQKK